VSKQVGLHRNRGRWIVPGRAWRVPVYRPGGARHGGGESVRGQAVLLVGTGQGRGHSRNRGMPEARRARSMRYCGPPMGGFARGRGRLWCLEIVAEGDARRPRGFGPTAVRGAKCQAGYRHSCVNEIAVRMRKSVLWITEVIHHPRSPPAHCPTSTIIVAHQLHLSRFTAT
jgi:hypothetical protein